VCVPAYHEAYVQVEMPQRFNNQDVLLEQPPRVLSVSVARALAFCKNNKTLPCIKYKYVFCDLEKRSKIS